MADGGFEKILLQLGLDLSPLHESLAVAKQMLGGLNEAAKAFEAGAVSAIKGQVAGLTDVKATTTQITGAAHEAATAQGESTVSIREAVAQLRQGIELRLRELMTARETVAAAREATTATKEQTAATAATTAESNKGLSAAAEKLAVLKRQTEELKKQKAEHAEGGEGLAGALGQVGSDVLKGALGGGVFGQVAGGVLAGEGMVQIIEQAGRALERFIDKLKDVSVESGNLISLENAFQRLAAGSGVDATKMLVNLQEASEGLVSKLTLLKLATAALRTPYHISSEAVVELTRSVVALSESSGHTAEEGIAALNQSIVRGSTYMLASVTGVAALRNVMRDIPPVMNASQRATEEWSRALVLLKAQAENVSPLPPTLEKIMTQMKVAGQNLILAFGEGLNQSEGISHLSKLFDMIEGKFASMTTFAQTAGNSVGNALASIADAAVWVVRHLDDIKQAAIALTAVLLAMLIGPKVIAFAETFTSLTKAIRIATGATIEMSAAQKELAASNLLVAGLTLIFYGLFKFFDQAKDEVQKATGLTVTWGDVMHGTITTVITDLKLALTVLKDMIGAATGNPFALWRIPKDIHEFMTGSHDIDKGIAQATMARTVGTMEDPGEVGDYMNRTFMEAMQKPTADTGDQLTPSQKAQIAQARLKQQTAEAKERLDQKKDLIEQEKAMDAEAYAAGEETFDQHQKNLLKIAQESHDAQLQELKENEVAQNKALALEVAAGTKLAQVANAEKAANDANYRAGVLSADMAYETQRSKIAVDGIKARQATNIEAAKAQEQEITQRERAAAQMSQRKVNSGETSPDDFFGQRIDQIEAIATAQINAANEVYRNSANNEKSLEVRSAAIQKSVQEASAQMDQLIQAQAQVELRSVEHRFQPQERALQQQLQAYQEQRNEGGNVPITGTLEELKDNLQQQLEGYQRVMESMTGTTQEFSDVWWQTYSRMESTYQLMVKYNEELQKSKDYAQPLGEIFNSLDNIANLWTSKWARNFTSVFSGAIKAMEESSSRRDTILNALGKGPQVQKSPQMLELEEAGRSAQATLQGTDTETQRLGMSFVALRERIIEVAEAMGMLTGQGETVPTHTPDYVFDPNKLQSVERPIPEPIFPELPVPVAPTVLGPQGQVAPQPTTFPTATPQNETVSQHTASQNPLVAALVGAASPITALGASATSAVSALNQFAQKLASPYVPTAPPAPPPTPQTILTQTTPDLKTAIPETAAISVVSQLSTESTDASSKSINRLGTAADATITALDQLAKKLIAPVQQSVTVTAAPPTVDTLETQNPDLSSQHVEEQQVQAEDASALPSADDGSKKASFDSFAKGLTAAIGALTDFAAAISHSKSAITGAVGGGTAGYGAGNAIGGGLAAMSDSLSFLGPFGGAIGAGVGAVVGAFVGQKNSRVEDEVSQLSSQYSGIMESFAQNTDNLNATIVKLQQLILQAQEDEANSKKGKSQFASMISEYSQELDSLTNQASTLMSQMETQLAIFETPSGMQSFLSSLQQIIEQYDKFAGAAQNASQLAQANEWLADSLSNFTQNLNNTYVNDEESAIGDALSLNSLLSERSNLISNLNDQVMGVLEEGVLTRQQTTAMKKGQRIATLESNASDQLQSIDQQISLEQYKVSIEQYIFNLATTKIGLETQLLQLQEQQSSQSMAQIQALQQLINALQSGSFNFTTLQSLLNALGYTGAAGLIPPSTLTNPVGPIGQATAPEGHTDNTNRWDTAATSAYQSRAAMGYGNYRGTNL